MRTPRRTLNQPLAVPRVGPVLVAPAGRRDQVPERFRCAAGLAQAVAEILAGARPVDQLCGLATFDVLRLLSRGAGRLTARPGMPPQRPIVSAVHLSEPCAGVVEASAVIFLGLRARALALRIESHDGRWLCTAIRVG
jgi:hypothetical protein